MEIKLLVACLCLRYDRSGLQLNDSRSNVANRDNGQRATSVEVRSHLTPTQAAVMLHVVFLLSGLGYRCYGERIQCSTSKGSWKPCAKSGNEGTPDHLIHKSFVSITRRRLQKFFTYLHT